MIINNSIKITFLGTGTSQGIPVIGCDCAACLSDNPKDKRLRTSILIQIGETNLVVDAGPDFRQQMLRAGVQKVDAILLTHEHNDHIIGIDDVRPFNFKYRKDMPVYATEQVQQDLKHRFSYIFETIPYPGAPRLELRTIYKNQPFFINGIKIIPIKVEHGQLPVLGFRIGDFTYITDMKTISSTELEKAKGSKVLVLNALHREEHHSHLNLQQAIEMSVLMQAEQTWLTHLSHRMGTHKSTSQELPQGVAIAYDGLVVTTK